ncbi:MAG: glycerol-3-phosphate 1-O-acyltransferase PlsY [Defluviitaleaceae bacterium]|nr:glycerol-3-phosphate 1-O-acyltransferase PlsY [Defluviitaleaceae bacterium]
MNTVIFRALCLGLGYAVGLIQTAFIVGKLMGKGDIRKHGSGNAGTTNAVRVLGFKAGLTVFLCDVLKAVIGFVVCMLIFRDNMPLAGIYGGLGVILGHNFPFYLKFRGGKGSASFVGLVLCLGFVDYRVLLVVYISGLIVAILSKYISLASLVITLLLPISLGIFGFGLEAIILGGIIACLSWVMHRKNIARLLKGEENKFNFKKQS